MDDSAKVLAVDESLLLLSSHGPEFGHGLTNHGPMVVEALASMGQFQAIKVWTGNYCRSLEAVSGPPVRPSIAPLPDIGEPRQFAQWQSHFVAEIECHGWRPVLGQWWAILLGGVAAGASHGILRTAHATRLLAARETTIRREELAAALAYWAANFESLPGIQDASGTLDVDSCLSRIPLVRGPVRDELIRNRLKRVRQASGFPEAIVALAPPSDPARGLLQIAAAFARLFVRFATWRPTALAHGITVPVAVASVLPYLPPRDAIRSHAAVWQLAAALYSAHMRGAVSTPSPTQCDGFQLPKLTELAVASGDEHAIKLTEACSRAVAATSETVFVDAARAGVCVFPESDGL